MSTNVSAEDLRQLMKTRYRDERASEDETTAVGVVLLAAGMHSITSVSELVQLTGYSRSFVSSIVFNLQNNRLWKEGGYDASSWLTDEGEISNLEFRVHINAACGEVWLPGADSELAVSACEIFRADEQRGFTRNQPNLAQWNDLQCDDCHELAAHAKVDIEEFQQDGDATILSALCHEHYAYNVLRTMWLHKPTS